MLVNFSVQNYASFKGPQSLRMEAVSTPRDDFLLNNVQEIPEKNDRVLKSSLIFGANASGKSNFIRAIYTFKDIVLRSRLILEEGKNPLDSIIPYLLDENIQKATLFEVVFYEQGIKYRYGLEVHAGTISGEWLYYTPSKRETLLFERNEQTLDSINEKNFPGTSRFQHEKTLKGVSASTPLVSELVNENQHAKNVISWFNRLRIISGVQEEGFLGYTLQLLQKDEAFRSWAKALLENFQIADLELVEVVTDSPGFNVQLSDEGHKKLVTSNQVKKLELRIVKKQGTAADTRKIVFPLSFESEGTRKLIHLLGPIYDAIEKNRILVIDELEAKFHSNVTKLLFRIFHKENHSGSQIIAAVHDTSLMDTSVFRRDQINFANKNETGESEIYSLAEFKEKARKIKEHYGKEYLAGAFGAVMLFENFEQLAEVMSDE